MAWSITQVARTAKVTSRTLRHYDEIGLLPPAWVGGNGYRYYEQEQLLRLQQIMLFRELGLGLDTIAEILDGRHDAVEVLRNHRRWLREEQDRLGRLARTVDRTIAQLEGGEAMKPEQLFEGFDIDSERQARYEAELVERYGEDIKDSIADTKRRMRGWSKEQTQRIQQDGEEIWARVVELLDDGVAADDPRTIEVIERHYNWICHFWTPNRESYTGLGQLYVDSPDFKNKFDAVHPGLAVYLRDVIAAYARARLS